eukprot:4193137-Amphidinium_carterae.4
MAADMYDPGATDPLEQTREKTHRFDADDDMDAEKMPRFDLEQIADTQNPHDFGGSGSAPEGELPRLKRQRLDGGHERHEEPPQPQRVKYRIRGKRKVYLDRTAEDLADEIPPQVIRHRITGKRKADADRVPEEIMEDTPSQGDGYVHTHGPLDPRLHDPEYTAPTEAQDGNPGGYDQGDVEPLPALKRARMIDQDWSQYLSESLLYVHSRTSPAFVALVGAARARHEVKWESLSTAEKLEFDAAIKKEWDVWEQYAATRVLSEDERVFVWKEHGPLEQRGRKAKARLVVQGFKEKHQSWESWSPTSSSFSLHMVMILGSSPGWSVYGFDCKNAYLQSKLNHNALQVLRMPRQQPLVPGTKPGELRVAMRPIYGLVDAGLQWYLHFKKVMREHNVGELNTEPGLYVRRDVNGNLILVLHSHVDDALVAIDGSEESRTLLNQLAKALNAQEMLEEVTEEPRS